MKKLKTAVKLAPLAALSLVLIVASTTPVEATVPGTNTMMSVDGSGSQGGSASQYPSMSRDGRYVVFSSNSSLVSNDNNSTEDVFLRDTQANTTTRVSVSTNGTQANGASRSPVISGDGRYVVFYSFAKNLIDGTTLTGNASHVYVRDLQASTTEMADVTTGGTIGDALGGDIDGQDISEDGRFVVFQSNATNIDSAGNFGTTKVFVRDRLLNTTTVLSKSNGGTVSGARYPSMSCDGAFVSFTSASNSLTTGDTNGKDDVFLVQRVGGDYITNLTQAGTLDSGISKVSCNGNYIGITTKATLDAADSDSQNDNYVYDRLKNSFDRVNISSSENAANTAADLAGTVTVSDDGRYAVFLSTATNLDSIATSGYAQVYMRDRTTGTTEIVSKDSTPAEGNNDSGTNASFRSGPEVSPSGKYVVYGSKATNLVSPDINSQPDIFLAPTGN